MIKVKILKQGMILLSVLLLFLCVGFLIIIIIIYLFIYFSVVSCSLI